MDNPGGWGLTLSGGSLRRARLRALRGERCSARHRANPELALSRATGDLIQVLDQDDVLLPSALASLIPLFDGTPIHWAVGQADDLMPDGRRIEWESALPYGTIAAGTVNAWAEAHEANWPIHCAGLMLRTTALRAVGGWIGLPADEECLHVRRTIGNQRRAQLRRDYVAVPPAPTAGDPNAAHRRPQRRKPTLRPSTRQGHTTHWPHLQRPGSVRLRSELSRRERWPGRQGWPSPNTLT